MREALINPGAIDGHRGWKSYLANINKAANFHFQLGSKYHPHTYTFHGDSKRAGYGLTWGTAGWFATMGNARFDPPAMELLAMQVVSDDGDGQVLVDRGPSRLFYMAGADCAGDGTVPIHSGKFPATSGARATYYVDLLDQGHEGAYSVEMARRITLHAVLRIAQTVSILE